MRSFRKIFLVLLAAALVFGFAPKHAQASDEEKVCYYDGFYGYDYGQATVTDATGKEIAVSEAVADGTTLTVKITLNEDSQWGEQKSIYIQGNNYELDENNSAEFTIDADYSTWFSDDFTYNCVPTKSYPVKIKADSHVKSYEFISEDGKVNSFPAGEKEYRIDSAWALSSGAIGMRIIFEDGYECDTASFNTVKVKEYGESYTYYTGSTSITSDPDYFYIFIYTNSTVEYNHTLKIVSKEKKADLLDNKKLNIAVPKVKTSKLKKVYANDDYYQGSTTLTFGKGKKATVFTITNYRYGKKGSVESYLNYDENTGSDLANYEVFDLTGVTGLSDYVVYSLVERIYHFYKQGKIPNLKAIYLPAGQVVELMSYDDEYRYYPVEVITVH
ncbi:MAG: hypothetical protein K6E62_05990 [Lachnospiraceae bacterium]|nr:hypothetical protein [Lachnospiraceae bacterium]